MKYKAIVFDKDGTLLDFNRTWLPVYEFAALEIANNDRALANHLLENHGFDSKTQKFAGGSLLAAGNNDEIARAWAKDINRLEDEMMFNERLGQIFTQQGALSSTPVKDLKLTLEKLKSAGFKLGVATADSHSGILNTLEAFDVLDLFDYLAGFDSGFGIKPEGRMVMSFCEQHGISGEETVVVGDNRHDIEMGRNANAGLCVGVLTGTSSRHDLETIADIVLNDISELPEYL